MGWLVLFVVLAVIFGASLFTALAWIIKVLLFIAAIVVLGRVIRGERVL